MLLWTNARTIVSPAIALDGPGAGSQSCSDAGEGSGTGNRGKIDHGRSSQRRDCKSSGSRWDDDR